MNLRPLKIRLAKQTYEPKGILKSRDPSVVSLPLDDSYVADVEKRRFSIRCLFTVRDTPRLRPDGPVIPKEREDSCF